MKIFKYTQKFIFLNFLFSLVIIGVGVFFGLHIISLRGWARIIIYIIWIALVLKFGMLSLIALSHRYVINSKGISEVWGKNSINVLREIAWRDIEIMKVQWCRSIVTEITLYSKEKKIQYLLNNDHIKNFQNMAEILKNYANKELNIKLVETKYPN